MSAAPLPQHALRVDTFTWQRDSHDLYDYEAPQVEQKRFWVSRHVRIYRVGTEIQVCPNGQELPASTYQSIPDFLLTVKIKDGRYIIQSSNAERFSTNVSTKKLWLIVKELPEKKHFLQESDVIKLGRFKLKVKQLARCTDVNSPNPELRLDDTEVPITQITPEEAQTMQCRICLLEGGTSDDPLVCPCHCRGSIKFVHVECLKHWINGRLNLTDESKFFFKTQLCELCKQHFPLAVTLPDGERIPIVNVPNPPPPFIVLENLAATKGVHVFSMAEKKTLKLGRGHESDVRIPDVSISRYHATIRLSDGSFSLDDYNSKFGTLVALRRPQTLDCGEKFSVQVGRTVLRFSIDETKAGTGEVEEEIVSPAEHPSQPPQAMEKSTNEIPRVDQGEAECGGRSHSSQIGGPHQTSANNFFSQNVETPRLGEGGFRDPSSEVDPHRTARSSGAFPVLHQQAAVTAFLQAQLLAATNQGEECNRTARDDSSSSAVSSAALAAALAFTVAQSQQQQQNASSIPNNQRPTVSNFNELAAFAAAAASSSASTSPSEENQAALRAYSENFFRQMAAATQQTLQQQQRTLQGGAVPPVSVPLSLEASRDILRAVAATGLSRGPILSAAAAHQGAASTDSPQHHPEPSAAFVPPSESQSDLNMAPLERTNSSSSRMLVDSPGIVEVAPPSASRSAEGSADQEG